jgi:gas vesicle protein
MSSEFGNGMKNFAVGAGIGLGLGVIAGILLAPKSGKETLNDFSNGARRIAETAKKDMNNVEKQIMDKVDSISGAISKMERNTKDGMARGIRKASDVAEETVDAAKAGIDNLVKGVEKLQANN